MHTYEFNIFADYFALYLEDETAEQFKWSKSIVDDWVPVYPRRIAIQTARNMTVPVTVEVCEADEPVGNDSDLSRWDHVVECSIEIPSGKLVVMGTTDYWPEAPRILLPPGSYQARIYFRDLDKLSQSGLDGDDYYRILLYPGPSIRLRVLKHRAAPA